MDYPKKNRDFYKWISTKTFLLVKLFNFKLYAIKLIKGIFDYVQEGDHSFCEHVSIKY